MMSSMTSNPIACNECRHLMDAYLDNELETGVAINIATHLKTCAACQNECQQAVKSRQQRVAHLQRYSAPDLLKQNIVASLNKIEQSKTRQANQTKFHAWSAWFMPTFSTAVLLLSFGFFWFKPAPKDIFFDELVSTHVRSLQEQHLMDVVSTDQHTVKPWFAGRLDFAPAVFDFSAEAYPLIGGRLDYLDHQTVAALVYKHNKHIINVFVAPVTQDSLSEISASKRGYSLLVWQQNRLEYSAVSDLNMDELKILAEKMRAKNLNDL